MMNATRGKSFEDYLEKREPEASPKCKYCETSSDDGMCFIASGYVAEDRKDNIHISAFLHRDIMIFSANFLTIEAKINFCPMCGRQLSNENMPQEARERRP